MKVQGSLSANTKVADSDLCVLLCNACENAIQACQPLRARGIACGVDVTFYERSGKFFFQITNPCDEDVRLENGVPVTDRPNHGIGIQSICAVVQRYGGVYSFAVQEGRFILRLSL